MTDPDDTMAEALVDDLRKVAGFSHGRCHEHVVVMMSRVRLTRTELGVLLYLRGGRRRPTLSQAAAVMRVSLPCASRSVAELAGRGLLRRERDDLDGRAKRLVITEHGEQVAAELNQAELEGCEEQVARLTPREREQLYESLGPLVGRPTPEHAKAAA